MSDDDAKTARQNQIARMLAVQIYVADTQYIRAERGSAPTSDYSWRKLTDDRKRFYIAQASALLETLVERVVDGEEVSE